MNFNERTKLNSQVSDFIEAQLESESLNLITRSELFSSLKLISGFVANSLSSEFYFGPYLKLLIAIGTTALKGDGADKKISRICISYLKQKISDLKKDNLGHLIMICADQILFRTDLEKLDVIPAKLKQKIRDAVSIIEPIDTNSTLRIKKDVHQNLKILMQNSSISISLERSLGLVFSKCSEESSDGLLARKAIAYLIQEEDFLDDKLGIFGLADDIFVIEETAALIGGLNFGQSFLIELGSQVDHEENLYFESDKQLHPLGPQTQLILKTLRHTAQDNKSKVVLVLPKIGPTSILFLLDRFISEAPKNDSYEKVPKIGDEIYFRIIDGFVAATFSGYVERDGSNIPMLKFTDDPNSAQISVSQSILVNSIKRVPKNARIFRNQKNYYQKRNQDAPFVPRHLQLISNPTETVILYTQKKHFDEMIKLVRPFGLNCLDLFQVKYKTSKGDFKLSGHGPIELLVCSDEGVARELVMDAIKDEKPVNLIIEFASNCSGLISSLGDFRLREVDNVTCLVSNTDFEVLDELDNFDFNLIYLKDVFSDLGFNHSAKINPVRRYEHLLTNSVKPCEFKFKDLSLPTIDKFHTIFRQLFSDLLETDGDLKYLLARFRGDLIWNPLPFSEIQLEQRLMERDIVAGQLKYYQHGSCQLFYQLITEHWDQLLQEISSRNLLDAIEKEASDEIAVFARSSAEAKRLSVFLEANGLSTIPIITLTSNTFDEKLDAILIPAMPSKRVRATLAQTKLAKKAIFNFTPSESEMFLSAKKRSEHLEYSLMKKSEKTFQTISSYSRKLETTKPKPQKPEMDLVDLDELETQRIRKEISHNDAAGTDITLVPFLLSNRTEYILIPENAQVIKLDKTANSFNFERQSLLQEGDYILLRNSNDANYISGFAEKVFPTFKQDLQKARIWKEKLLAVQKLQEYSPTVLSRLLDEKVQLKRSVATVQNWLAQGDTVAPQDSQNDLRQLNKFLGDYGYGFDYEMTISAIENVYKVRAESRELLMNYLTGKNFDEIEPNIEVSVKVDDFEFDMIVKEIAGRSATFEASYSQSWQVKSFES